MYSTMPQKTYDALMSDMQGFILCAREVTQKTLDPEMRPLLLNSWFERVKAVQDLLHPIVDDALHDHYWDYWEEIGMRNNTFQVSSRSFTEYINEPPGSGAEIFLEEVKNGTGQWEKGLERWSIPKRLIVG